MTLHALGFEPKEFRSRAETFAETASFDRPTVILVKTVKGDGMGAAAQGRNNAHQKKDLSAAERLACARAYGIPLSAEEIERVLAAKSSTDKKDGGSAN